MTFEEHLRMLGGDLLFRVAQLAAEVDALNAKAKELDALETKAKDADADRRDQRGD